MKECLRVLKQIHPGYCFQGLKLEPQGLGGVWLPNSRIVAFFLVFLASHSGHGLELSTCHPFLAYALVQKSYPNVAARASLIQDRGLIEVSEGKGFFGGTPGPASLNDIVLIHKDPRSTLQLNICTELSKQQPVLWD